MKPQVNKAVVSGINKVKKHQKPDNNQAGGIIEKEMPIQISNLAYYDSTSKKGVKLGFKFDDKNNKIRIIINSGKLVYLLLYCMKNLKIL
jgi:large subunit ribosomal protein L24